MLVIGLTGGIGSGKSTVAELFASLGIAITDTDVIAHQLTAVGQPALEEIASAFGKEILQKDGSLNRPLLRKSVFADVEAKKKLENILHPRIREAVKAELAEATKAPYRIVVVPLLLETGAYEGIINRVLVVDCPEQQQLQRVLARSSLTEAEARAIMATQSSREQRLHRADDVITNDAEQEKLNHQVSELHKKYLTLA
ncbi:MAG: dephospho-CoA kinase [Methylophilales bacterium]|nr:dephospho-CoA kinase [Methylophilales bacterium]